MRNALLICTVLGIASVAGAAYAHEYAPYHHHHYYHPGVVVAPPPVIVARPACPAVVAPGPVMSYSPYAPVLVPAPAYAPAPHAAFRYYGRGFGVSVGF